MCLRVRSPLPTWPRCGGVISGRVGAKCLVGFSMGGLIAQELAVSRPDLVRTLTLGCTSPGGPDAILLSQEVAELFVELQNIPAPEAALRAAPVVYANSTPRSAVRADINVRMARPTSRVGYRMQLAAVGQYSGFGHGSPSLTARFSSCMARPT